MFQSTLPARAATCESKGITKDNIVSIHAARAGSDVS